MMATVNTLSKTSKIIINKLFGLFTCYWDTCPQNLYYWVVWLAEDPLTACQ